MKNRRGFSRLRIALAVSVRASLATAQNRHVVLSRYNQSYMSLIVVGSVAYDGVETPHGKVDRMLGGAAPTFPWPPAISRKVSIVAVVGDDFAQEDIDLLASRGIDLEGLERVARQDLLLGRRILAGHERSRDAAHRSERLRRLQSQAAGELPDRAVPAAGQHPARACSAACARR